MKSIKCPSCGLANWSTIATCKRCGAAFMSEAMPFDNLSGESAYYQNANQQQFANYASTVPVKSGRLISFGILFLMLGSIFTILHVGASMRMVKSPPYFLVLGLSIMASGVFFCMKQWAAVYVYLAGFGLAMLTMFITEGAIPKPHVRLGGPVILGLFLINKMLKAKKAESAQYAVQG